MDTMQTNVEKINARAFRGYKFEKKNRKKYEFDIHWLIQFLVLWHLNLVSLLSEVKPIILWPCFSLSRDWKRET